ncbi:SRPBCC family protein [Gemmatirosa kalamazoonensis]|uniref:SRPBCC family protein n=1 Tax=Gemmatirosa kalamazoonensis TaxID=861299 RepID=UPI001F1A7A3B|nr:SRPBCC domain-containing protein [Gemmatirosa kalamazoonensis]
MRAPRQRVFDAWTQPAQLKAWHAPGPLTVSLAEIDLRPGGAYRIHMRAPDGTEHRVTGVYREVDPPSRVVYTWGWEGDHVVKDSVVTVEFHDRGDTTGDATEVVLTHAGIFDDTERANHAKGWTAILDKFEALYPGGAA